jgi:hypothetical protein
MGGRNVVEHYLVDLPSNNPLQGTSIVEAFTKQTKVGLPESTL